MEGYHLRTRGNLQNIMYISYNG